MIQASLYNKKMDRFRQSIINKKSENCIPVIVDFKCISPGEGWLLKAEEAPGYALKMQEAGVPAISVVTEPKDFGGSLKLLEKIVETVDIPVLRKDFIRTTEEIDVSISCGASAVLLMCSVMSEEAMRKCYSYSLEKGIEPFVETHNPKEMRLALELGAELMGINNRNILELERDGGTVGTTVEVMNQVHGTADDKNRVLVSESGILTPEDAVRAVKSGADAVLIGTAIWKSEDPVGFMKKVSQSAVK